MCSGFVKYKRANNQYRSAERRLKDWDEIYNHDAVMNGIHQQAARYTLLLSTAVCVSVSVSVCVCVYDAVMNGIHQQAARYTLCVSTAVCVSVSVFIYIHVVVRTNS